jgi:hypothetical protein
VNLSLLRYDKSHSIVPGSRIEALFSMTRRFSREEVIHEAFFARYVRPLRRDASTPPLIQVLPGDDFLS